jgi:hypothetical protein
MPNEPRSGQHCLALSAIVSDAVDGATRLLTEIAKVGLRVLETHVVGDWDGQQRLHMRIAAPMGTDIVNISSRLARHVCVISLRLA